MPASEFPVVHRISKNTRDGSRTLCVLRWPQDFFAKLASCPRTIFGEKVYAHFPCATAGLPHPQTKAPPSIWMIGCYEAWVVSHKLCEQLRNDTTNSSINLFHISAAIQNQPQTTVQPLRNHFSKVRASYEISLSRAS